MYSLLKKVLPESLKNKLWLTLVQVIRKKLKDQDNRLPKYTLGNEHVKHLKSLVNRHELLEILPKNGIVAELGVNAGDFSEEILDICKPAKLHLVDVWDSKRYHKGLMHSIEKKFEKEIQNQLVEINLGLSTEIGQTFADNYFDWIYIDTDHSYKTTKEELALYAPKMKAGGIIAGHDFILGNWVGLIRYGVIEAVYEFCSINNWEIIYLTMDLNEYPSFAIRKNV